MKEIKSLEDIETAINNNDFILLYFSTPDCNVCKALKPKIEELVSEFPDLKNYYINLAELQEATGKYSIFSIPAILIYFNSKELLREVRYISLHRIRGSISRYNQLFY